MKVSGIIIKSSGRWHVSCDLDTEAGGMCGKCSLDGFCHDNYKLRLIRLCRDCFSSRSGRFRRMTRADFAELLLTPFWPKGILMRVSGGGWVVMRRHPGGAASGCGGCGLQGVCKPDKELFGLCTAVVWPYGGFPKATHGDAMSGMEGLS